MKRYKAFGRLNKWFVLLGWFVPCDGRIPVQDRYSFNVSKSECINLRWRGLVICEYLLYEPPVAYSPCTSPPTDPHPPAEQTSLPSCRKHYWKKLAIKLGVGCVKAGHATSHPTLPLSVLCSLYKLLNCLMLRERRVKV